MPIRTTMLGAGNHTSTRTDGTTDVSQRPARGAGVRVRHVTSPGLSRLRLRAGTLWLMSESYSSQVPPLPKEVLLIPRTASLSVLIVGPLLLPQPARAGDPPLCFHREATIVGTAEDERIVGTPGPDVIHGLGGMDQVRGAGGRDLICGGAGEDSLLGGDGGDHLGGGGGGDLLRGEDGRDDLRGYVGADVLYGGRGADRFNGGTDRDLCASNPEDRAPRRCDGDPRA